MSEPDEFAAFLERCFGAAYDASPPLEIAGKFERVAIEATGASSGAFLANDFAGALRHANRAVAHAPPASESLGRAYAARAAALYRLGLLRDSANDVARACARPELVRAPPERRDVESEWGASGGRAFAEPSEALVRLGDHGVVATRRVRPGELLALERPYLKFVDREHATSHCRRCCANRDAMIACESCATAMFCDDACRSACDAHEFECGLALSNGARAALQLVTAARRDGSLNGLERSIWHDDALEPGCYLRAHSSLRRGARRPPRSEYERAAPEIAALVRHLDERTAFFERYESRVRFVGSLLLDASVCGIRFRMVDDRVHGYAELLGLLEHSCAPNAFVVPTGERLALVAWRPIEPDAPVALSYIKPYYKLDMRGRVERLDRLFVRCRCDACAFGWPTIAYHRLVEHKKLLLELKTLCCRKNGRALLKFFKRTNDAIAKLSPLEPCAHLCMHSELARLCLLSLKSGDESDIAAEFVKYIASFPT